MIHRFGDCELDEGRFELRRGGVPCHLEPQVFEVLAYLVRNRGRLVPKAELLDQIWGSRFVSESALTSRVKAARRAVGDSGREQRVIRTVHGRGYEFLAPVQPASAGAVDGRERAPSGSATLPQRGAEPGAGSVQAAPAALAGRGPELERLTRLLG
jgi:DNA-binding winged helix-turn-helix (wHTH) protein